MNLFFAIVIGFVAGWLINYLSDVLPTLRRLTRPVCSECGAAFSWQDYFLIQTCRQCKHARSWRVLIVLFATVIVSTLLSINSPVQLGYGLSLLMLTYFGVVLVIDLEHRLILHMVSLVGACIGLIAGIVSHGLVSTLVGGLAGLLIMLIFYLFGMLFARYRARRLGVEDDEEALGFGDVILSTIIGLMLGWPQITKALILAILAGGLFSLGIIVVLSATRRFQSMNVFIAYGPYLVFGAILLIFFPQVAAFLTGN